jgi:hypothetical protein
LAKHYFQNISLPLAVERLSRFNFSLSVSDVRSRLLHSLCEYLTLALAIAISGTTSLVL